MPHCPRVVEAQTREVFDKLERVPLSLGPSLERALGVCVFLTEFSRDYEAMNRIHESCFPADRRPARACIGVTGLARHGLVEIDSIARRPRGLAPSVCIGSWCGIGGIG